MNPRTQTPPAPGERSRSPSMVIHVEQTVTVETVYEEPLAADSTARPFGDNSNFYQATVSAASQLARALFSAPTPQSHHIHEHDDDSNLPLTRPQTRKWICTAVLLAMANLITYAVDSMMSVLAPTIAYDIDVQGFQWLLAGPAIGAAATVLAAGQLYAVLPFKAVYTLFVVLLLLGIMSPGFASYMTFLFYTRVLVGVGLAGQQLGALIFLGHNGQFVDKVRRDFYISISTALGFIIGPILGALFSHRHKLWGWGFYAAAMLLALVQIVLIYLLPNKFDMDQNALWNVGDILAWGSWRVVVRIDFLGCVLSFFGILTLLISFNLAGSWIAWSDAYLYVPFGMGGILMLLLCIQQYFQVCASRLTLLFPTRYLRCFKTTALFILTFLTSGIFQAVFAYSALYQLLTRPGPSPISTAFYLLFSFTGPYLIPLIIVPLYFGGGLIKKYPRAASLSLWSVVISVFLVTGTLLLFLNTPARLPPQGLPTIAKQFALACIGFWSAVSLPLAHQILDVFQPIDPPNPRQKHPYHNRSFVLFATYLGAAVALTVTGSMFMHIGPRATLSLLHEYQGQHQPHGIAATPEDARILMLGYTFILQGETPALFAASIRAIENTFGSIFAVPLGFAILMLLLSLGYLIGKLYLDGWKLKTLTESGVPDDWRKAVEHRGRSRTRVEAGGRVTELEERGTSSSANFGTATRTTHVRGPCTPTLP
ncbi:hypothetical protein A1O3_08487 [Capronia epimyces CBS 606.96]|uniref:Major facilitator superfamily (MFS) profile domain-containing protein n=1 Tax=Capronia epimyces CBS 606.96 TaxID=1182542 RepID=W9XEQ7_9EURO|nr:uncharacterized protein A1O3_08487 [Capronia epimyces CBS 606.96]EXJ78987.1 hypothetical protein A1O3_08487 [Capronia epimyces CBS 606.96]